MSAPACSPTTPRDSVPEGTREVRGDDPNGADASAGASYEHVARRPHATVALAESRGLARAQVAAAIEALADRLELCTRDLTPEQAGLARIVAQVADDGTVEGVALPVVSGHPPTALRCLVAPVKLLILPPEGPPAGRKRGFAMEAEWRP